MYNELQMNQMRLAQEIYAYEARQMIGANIRLQEHYNRNQMDLEKMEEAEKKRLDLRKEKEYQQTYLLENPDGDLILVEEQFLKKLKKRLSIWNRKALRLRSCESGKESILFVSFLFGPAGEEKEVLMFLDEKRLGEPHYVNRIFASKGVGFQFGRTTEANAKKLFIEKMQSQAVDLIIPEIPGWYRTGGQWEYEFPEGIYWKEVTRWAL